MTFTARLNAATAGCPTGLLTFDDQNPRLEDGRERVLRTDQDIILSLKEVAALSELIASICANKYMDIEPLIVMGDESGPFTVLEGNRRLASIKLIQDADLASRCRIAIPEITPEVLASTKQVTIYRVENLDAARAFIGFKHINGPHRWESFAKARYVTKWFKEGRDSGVTIDSIARELGDDNSTIRSMIAGMLVLEQSEEMGIFSIEDKYNRGRFGFSHLYTALTRNEYQNYLGLEKGWNQHPDLNPVSSSKKEEMQNILTWLYGSKSRDIAPLIRSQNPDLRHLGDVIANPVALAQIKSGAELSVALKELKPINALLGNSMVEVDGKLREAVGLAARMDAVEGSMKVLASNILNQASSLHTLISMRVPKAEDSIAE